MQLGALPERGHDFRPGSSGSGSDPATRAVGMSRQQLSRTLDALSERICRYSYVDRTIVFCNVAWATGHGSTPEQLIGRRLDDLLSPAELDALHSQLRLLGPGTPILQNTEPVPAPEMPDRWVRWLDHFIEEEAGPEVLAVGRDATDQYLATRRLETSEARFRELADRSADVIWRFSMVPVPHFDYMSPSVAAMTGHTAEEVMDDFSVFLDALDEDGLSMISAALEGEPLPRRCDMTFRHADGSLVIGEVQITDVHNGVQGVLRDVTEIRALQAVLAEQALRDQLTGLPNRRLLDEMLDSALRRTLRSGECVAILYVDLDGFKAVNDVHGHHAGDRVLREVARRLQAAVRDGDVVARVGGDEFVVLLEMPDTAEADLVGRIRTAMASPMGIGDGRTVTCGASIGISDTLAAGRNPDKLIAAADAAMYVDKRNGERSRRYGSASE